MEKPGLADAPALSVRPAMPLRAIWLSAAGAAFALYLATLAPDVLMMDSGEYQWQSWIFPNVFLPWGPEGLVRVHYNYLLLAKVFGILVPIGHWAFRINLLSAVAGSIAVGNACTLAYALTRSKPAVILTGLALAMGQTSWEYSVIAEVLPVMAAAISAEILLLYLWTTSHKFRYLLALWVINGLACGAHVQNGLSSPVYLIITLLAFWQGQIRLKQGLLCAAVWMIGFAPYLVFCLEQAYSKFGLIGTLESATKGLAGHRMLVLQSKVLLRGILSIVLNYPTGLALLFVPGLIQLARSSLPRSFRWGWLAVVGIQFLFVLPYNAPDQESFYVPFYAAAAALIGLGAAAVLKNRLAWGAAFALGLLVIPIYAVLPTLMQRPAIVARLPRLPSDIPYRNGFEFYLTPWKTGRHNERRYVEEAFAALPPHALFYCVSTASDGVRAVQLIESRRQDVTLNPPVASLSQNVRYLPDGSCEWRQPVYCWAAKGSGIPSALIDHCRFVQQGIVWQVLAPGQPQEFLGALHAGTAPAR